MAIGYTVKNGDSLTAIAARYNITLDELLAHNPNFARDKRNIDSIYVGETIIIPSESANSGAIDHQLADYQSYVLSKTATSKGLPSSVIKEIPEVVTAQSTTQLNDALSQINLDSIAVDYTQKSQLSDMDDGVYVSANSSRADPIASNTDIYKGALVSPAAIRDCDKPPLEYFDYSKDANHAAVYALQPTQPFLTATEVDRSAGQYKNVYFLSAVPRALMVLNEYRHTYKSGLTDAIHAHTIATSSYSPRTKMAYTAALSMNMPTGIFVAAQYGSKAIINLQALQRDDLDQHQIREHQFGFISNSAQSMNGAGIAYRAIGATQSTYYALKGAISDLSMVRNAHNSQWLLKVKMNAQKFRSVFEGITNMYPAQPDVARSTTYFSKAMQGAKDIVSAETLFGSSLNIIFGLTKTVSDYNHYSSAAYDRTAQDAEIRENIRDHYVVKGGLIHTANEAAPYIRNGSVLTWCWWLVCDRGAGYLHRAGRQNYFELDVVDANGVKEFIVNKDLATLDNKLTTLSVTSDYITKFFGAKIVRALVGKSKLELQRVESDNVNAQQEQLLDKMDSSQEFVRVNLNRLVYLGGTIAGVVLMRNFKHVTSIWINTIKTKLASSDMGELPKKLLTLTLGLEGDRPATWSKFIGAYMGFQSAHAVTQLASGILNNSTQTRAEMVKENARRGLVVESDARLGGRTGFADDYIANKLVNLYYSRSIEETLSDKQRRASQALLDKYDAALQNLDKNPFEKDNSVVSNSLKSMLPFRTKASDFVVLSSVHTSVKI